MAAGVGSLAAAILPLGQFEPPTDSARSQKVTQRPEAFAPNHNGFGFRNIFKGSPLPASLRGASSAPLKAVGESLTMEMGLPREFGLCGGMSLAAADFYLANRRVPDLSKPPEQGTPLYEYLYQRQTDSMGPMGVMALKFWTWMKLPDHSDTGDCTQTLTAKELPGIVSRLKARQLVPVGLVLTSNSIGKLWENHQILAYGVDEKDGGVVELKVYDPNFPGDDHVVVKLTPAEDVKEPAPAKKDGHAKSPAKPAPASPAKEYTCQRVSGKGVVKKVRGLFSMPYEPKVPPADLK